jgi:hypothetical protein
MDTDIFDGSKLVARDLLTGPAHYRKIRRRHPDTPRVSGRNGFTGNDMSIQDSIKWWKYNTEE